jgi:hypothetical protein
MTNFAGYYWTSWGLKQNNGYVTSVGAYIVAINKYEPMQWFSAVRPWGAPLVSSASAYIKGTRFSLRAHMQNSYRGTCDNAWGGTLYF